MTAAAAVAAAGAVAAPAAVTAAVAFAAVGVAAAAAVAAAAETVAASRHQSFGHFGLNCWNPAHMDSRHCHGLPPSSGSTAAQAYSSQA